MESPLEVAADSADTMIGDDESLLQMISVGVP